MLRTQVNKTLDKLIMLTFGRLTVSSTMENSTRLLFHLQKPAAMGSFAIDRGAGLFMEEMVNISQGILIPDFTSDVNLR